MNSLDMAASAIDMPPDAEPVMPASVGDGDGLVDQRIGDGPQRVLDGEEARQRRDDGAEAIFGRGVHRGQQRAADRRLAALGEASCQRLPKAKMNTVRMPASSAPSTAQTARIAATGVGMGWSMRERQVVVGAIDASIRPIEQAWKPPSRC